MRSTSATKQRGSQWSKLVENKIYISSQHITPMSAVVASKLDLIKQQISRQVKQVKRSDKKNNLNFTKINSSMKKMKSTSRLRNSASTYTATKLNFQEGDIREKYFEINQENLKEKRKNIQMREQYNKLKQAITEFLAQVTKQSSENLVVMLSSSKAEKDIQRIIAMGEERLTYQNSLIQIMGIMEVQDLQTLMQQLKEKGERIANLNKHNNLNECTYKILELEAGMNRLKAESQRKLQQMQEKYEEQKLELTKQFNEKSQKLNKTLSTLSQIQKKSEQQEIFMKKVMGDLFVIQSNWEAEEVQLISQNHQIVAVWTLIKRLYSKLQEIQFEAHNNMENFVKSNQQMQRLGKIINELQREFDLQMIQQQKNQEEKQERIQEMKIVIKQKNRQIEQLKADIKKLTAICSEKQQLLKQNRLKDSQIMKAITRNLQLKNQISTQQIAEKLCDLKQKLTSSQMYIEWYKKQLSAKEQFLNESNYNLQSLIIENKNLKQLIKDLSSQKQEYKFLINNLRQQIWEVKKEKQLDIEKIIEEKDNQIVNSNKDILDINTKLTSQVDQLKKQLKLCKKQLTDTKNQEEFLSKKSVTLQKNTKDLQDKNRKLNQDNGRMHKYMQDIEQSLKEMETLSDQVQKFQNQNRSLKKNLQFSTTQIASLEKRSKTLLADNNQLQDKAYQQSYEIKELKVKIQTLQCSNSQFQLSNIQKLQQLRKTQQDMKVLKKQHQKFANQNEQLKGKINKLTQRLIELSKLQATTSVINKYKQKIKDQIKRKIQQLRWKMQDIKTKSQTQLRKFSKQTQDMKKKIQQTLSLILSKQTQKTELINQLLEKKANINTASQTEQLQQNINQECLQQSVQIQVEIITQKEIIILQQHIDELQFNEKYFKEIIEQKNQMYSQKQQNWCDVKRQCKLKTQKLKKIVSVLTDCKQNIQEYKIISQNVLKLVSETKSIIMNSQFSQRLLLFIKEFVDKCLQQQILLPNQKSPKKKSNHLEDYINQDQCQLSTPTLNPLNIRSRSKSFHSSHASKASHVSQSEKLVDISFEDKRISRNKKMQEYEQQLENVVTILEHLRNDSSEDPDVPYFGSIKSIYNECKKLLHKKKNLMLEDISIVEQKGGTMSSPNSISICKEFNFDRLKSEPFEEISHTNRSQKHLTNTQKHNRQLSNELKTMQQQLQSLKQKYDQLHTQKQQLERRNTELENQDSTKTLKKMFERMMQQLLSEKPDRMQQFINCLRIVMKILDFKRQEIQHIQQNLKKNQKKKSGFWPFSKK